MLVQHGYLQSFSLIFLGKCSGHTLKLGLALVNLVGNISQVAGGHTVLVHNHKAGLTVISRTEAGIFKGLTVHKGGSFTAVFRGIKGSFVQSQQICKVAVGDSLSVINMRKIALINNSKCVKGILCIKRKHF